VGFGDDLILNSKATGTIGRKKKGTGRKEKVTVQEDVCQLVLVDSFPSYHIAT